jgi:hypothetical protein
MGQLRRQLVMWGAIATTTAVLPGLALADMASPEHGGGRHGRGDHSRGDRDRGDAKLSVAGRAVSKGDKDSYGLQIRGRSGEKPTAASGLVRFAHRGEGQMDGIVGEITCLSKDSAGVVTATGTIKRSGKRAKGDNKKGPGAAGLPTSANTSDDDAFLDEIVPWDADEAAEVVEVEAADPTVPGAPGAPSAPGQDPNKDKKDPNKDKKGERGRRGGGELAGKDFAFTIDVPGKPQKFSTPTIGEKGTLAACSGGGTPVEVTRGKFRAHEAGEKAEGGDGRRGDRHGRDGDHRRGRRGWHR